MSILARVTRLHSRTEAETAFDAAFAATLRLSQSLDWEASVARRHALRSLWQCSFIPACENRVYERMGGGGNHQQTARTPSLQYDIFAPRSYERDLEEGRPLLETIDEKRDEEALQENDFPGSETATLATRHEDTFWDGLVVVFRGSLQFLLAIGLQLLCILAMAVCFAYVVSGGHRRSNHHTSPQ